MVYCVVARGASRKVVDGLMRQFADDPTIEVVVDRRRTPRRAAEDRRRSMAGRGGRIVERRRVRHEAGRRVAERRAVLGPCFGQIELPRVARGHEDQIVFGTPLPQSVERLDEIEAARLALGHQAGDPRAFEALYGLWFDRAYTFFRTTHGQAQDVELAVNAAFYAVHERIGDYTPSSCEFRTWFARIVAEAALARVDAEHQDAAETRILDRWCGPTDLEALRWLGDDELLVLIRQLPSPQREVVALRYVFGLGTDEAASALDLPGADVDELHERALRFMSGCLTSLSRRPGFSGRLPMRERRRYYPVTTGRKRALVA
jgi:DNA-directed RNA polymerase specialized sigma24 family protein